MPKHGIMFTAFTSFAAIAVVFFSFRFRSEASSASISNARLMPLYTFIFILCSSFFVQIDTIFVNVITLLIISGGFAIFFIHSNSRFAKAAMSFLFSLFLFVILICISLSLLIGSFAATATVEECYSPSGKYYAYTVESDQGALGGSTAVYIRKANSLGPFQPKSKQIAAGRYGERYNLSFSDNNDLLSGEKIIYSLP